MATLEFISFFFFLSLVCNVDQILHWGFIFTILELIRMFVCVVCSVYATLYLGMSLGWPMVQCQILVSSLWAVFYYEEVTGRFDKSLLIGSSALVVSGVVMLSQFGTTN